jgi:quercetin dioxygenase-like cupin family protein
VSIKPFAVLPENRPRALNVVGEQLTILASKDATQGYEIFLQDGPQGSGPPPHSHQWDESFYVIRGEIEFGMDEVVMTGGPGTLVHVPGGTVHWFRFGTGGGQMISMTSAGSQASSLFTDIDAEIPAGPPDLEKLRDVANRNGLQVAFPA